MNLLDDAREEALRDVLEKARALVEVHREFMDNQLAFDRWTESFNELRVAFEVFDRIEAAQQ